MPQPARPFARRTAALAATAALVLCAIGASPAAGPRAVEAIASPPGKPVLTLVPVAGSGSYAEPVLVTGDGSSSRLFVVERTGRIQVIDGGVKQATPFLDLSHIGGFNDADDEEGLLGLVFDPAFATNHTFYVAYTKTDDSLQVASYTTASAGADTANTTPTPILDVAHPGEPNHNGGMLNFGPDGYLYIGTGDGGGADDPGAGCGNAQNKSSLLGKILRIDVDGATKPYGIPADNPFATSGGAKEVWAWGVRNPWRWSFDRGTGDMWIGEVGQNSYEEVDHVHGPNPGRALDFGWPYYEGFHVQDFHGAGCVASPPYQAPLLEYDHSKGCAIIGGFVYRGTEFPDLVGRYLFSDDCSGTIWDVQATAASPATPEVLLQTGLNVSGFGQDAAGELYVEDLAGGVSHVTSSVSRVYGPDRFATSAAVVGLGAYAPGGTVYLANGLAFPDALTAAPLAGRDRAPLLLVNAGLPLPATVTARLAALAPSHITIMGSTAAISAATASYLVNTYLGGQAAALTRLGGTDRFDTSAAAVDPLRSGKYTAGAGGVFITDGLNFPDGLGAAAVAGRLGWPLLLVRPTSIPGPVEKALIDLQPTKVVVLGGPDAVSPAVMQALQDLTSKVPIRISGPDRYATAASLAAAYPPDTVPPAVVFVADGAGFADGLSASPVAALDGTVLLLAPPTGALPTSVHDEICALTPDAMVVLGSSASVSDIVAGGLGTPCP
ncbi:MAG: cell wall-binding repeat-containing protein [Candidatus Limnocylindrales bacterium]